MKAKVYTAPGCAFCLLIENFLRQNKIAFEEIDVSKSGKAREEMIKKSGQESVPVTEINGKVIAGYKIREIREALGI